MIDKRVENGTYNGDPSRHARHPHGSGVLIAMLVGFCLMGLGVLGLRTLGLLS